MIDFHSQYAQLAWYVGLCLAIIFLAAGWLLSGHLPPPSPTFPEARDAFMYNRPQRAAQVGLWAFRLAVLGTFIGGFSARSGKWGTRLARILLALGLLLGIVEVPLYFRDAASYQALTMHGVIARDGRDTVQNYEWSSLHHVELSCRTGSFGQGVRVGLHLRFPGGYSIAVLSMKPFGMTFPQALVQVDDFRIAADAPLIWQSDVSRDLFRQGDSNTIRCVNAFVGIFPPDKRAAMLTTLSETSSLREGTRETDQRTRRAANVTRRPQAGAE